MFGKKNHDYRYGFPSQMKSNIRHNRRVLLWSLLLGLAAAAVLGLVIWYTNHLHRGAP